MNFIEGQQFKSESTNIDFHKFCIAQSIEKFVELCFGCCEALALNGVDGDGVRKGRWNGRGNNTILRIGNMRCMHMH